MDIGRLSKRIAIQKRTSSMDDIGNEINEWKDYYCCHATFSNVSGTENITGGQTLDTKNYSVVIRSCSLVNALNSIDYRLIHDGQIYNIKFVDTFSKGKGYIKIDVERALDGKAR